MKEITMFKSNCLRISNNTLFNEMHIVKDLEDFIKVVSKDYVCAEYKNHRSANANFIRADCLGMDIDNTHTYDESLLKI